ncbi:hypothetical protein BOTCAL_0719g00010 [Botryotinia calthae]|uniref:gamma-glutamylcyclotransferase n=1 Tax=Botryotinia calthae TaxID=38488 RepID=A0A4Y8CGR1_9HELO|nr:hypothetical protein BOTCAL_0719g00010 [Botryotinia calthae]
MRCPDSIFVGMGLLQDYRWMVNQRGYANIVFCGGEGEGEGEGAESEFGCEEGEEGGFEDGKDAENKNKNNPSPPLSPPLLKAAKETHFPNQKTTTTTTKLSSPPSQSTQTSVYGLLYTLSPRDETLLDTSEGVPFAYTKIHLRITLLSVSPSLSAPAVSFLLSLFPVSGSVSTSSIARLALAFPFASPSSSKPSHHSPTTITAITSQQSPPLQIRALTYIDTQRTTPSAPNPEYIARMNRGIWDALSKGFPSPEEASDDGDDGDDGGNDGDVMKDLKS